MKKLLITLLFLSIPPSYIIIAQQINPDADLVPTLGNQEAAYQWQMTDDPGESWNATGWDELAGDISRASGALGQLNTFVNLYQNAHDLYNATRALGNNECQPDFTTPATAMMPTHCESVECKACFREAVSELAFIRRQLGRLSCIYNNTKNFNSRAIAFGDNTSGVHAINGLAWQYAKADIVAGYESFKRAYDEKYTGMMGTLDKALHHIGTCEDKYGEQDWYQRSGFIYFEFMKDKYKRTD